jgi:hypothetical protein
MRYASDGSAEPIADEVRAVMATLLTRRARGVSARLDRWIDANHRVGAPGFGSSSLGPADEARPALLAPFPELRSQPWWDPAEAVGADLCAALERHAEAIYGEFLLGRELERKRADGEEAGALMKGWSLLPFVFLGRSLLAAVGAHPFPITAGILESSPQWAGALATADTYFSILARSLRGAAS